MRDKYLNLFVFRHRKDLIFIYHLAVVSLAVYTAFLLRFDGAIPDKFDAMVAYSIPTLLLIRIPLFSLFGLYKRGGSRVARLSGVSLVAEKVVNAWVNETITHFDVNPKCSA